MKACERNKREIDKKSERDNCGGRVREIARDREKK